MRTYNYDPLGQVNNMKYAELQKTHEQTKSPERRDQAESEVTPRRK